MARNYKAVGTKRWSEFATGYPAVNVFWNETALVSPSFCGATDNCWNRYVVSC